MERYNPLAGASSSKRTVSPVVARLWLIGAILVLAGAVLTIAASASPLSQSELAIDSGAAGMFVNVAPWLLVGGLTVLGFGAILHLVKQEKLAVPAFVVGAIMFLLAIAGFLVGFIGGIAIDQDGDEPPPGYVAKWECNFVTLASGGPGGAHDAVTEFPDSPFVAADAGTPDLNKVIATPIYDVPARRAVIDISIDDDAASTNVAFLDEDAYSLDVQCFLKNPTPAVGGGLQEIPLWGRISVTRTAGTINNGSYAPVFYGDVTAGTYLGFGKLADSGAAPDEHDADHSYISYDDAKPAPAAPALQGDWIQLGTSDGDVDGEYFAVFFVLDVGFSDFSAPALGSTDIFINIEMGTDPTSTGYKGNLVTLQCELNALVRT